MYSRGSSTNSAPPADADTVRVLRSCLLASYDAGFKVDDDAAVALAVDAISKAGGAAWALKAVNTNNALGVYFCTAEDAGSAIARARAEHCTSGEDSTRGRDNHWVFQQYLDAPLLYDGRKFHCRVNVLAIGALAVYVHQDIVVHVASEVRNGVSFLL